MIVYLDRIFIINFITDYIILHITSFFLGNKSVKRNIIASLFGGLYAGFMYFPSVSFLYNPFIRIIVSLIMIVISQKPSSFRSFYKSCLCFSAVSMFLGGGVFAVLFMAGYRFSEIMNNSIVVFDAKTPVLLVIFLICAWLCKVAVLALINSGKIREKTVKIEVNYGQKTITLNGIIDTGCVLYEPVSNKPVIVADFRKIGDFTKQNVRCCVIPYSTVDNSGTFVGFFADSIKIRDKKYYDIPIAVCYTSAMKDKQYSAIINSDILKEENSVV